MTKFFLPALHLFDARDEEAGIADHEAARFEQDLQAERLEQWHELRGVNLRGEKNGAFY